MARTTTVAVTPATRDELNKVRQAVADKLGRPVAHITHDEAITWLLELARQSEGQATP